MKRILKTRLIKDIEGQRGAFNMAADHRLASKLEESNFDAVVRFYTWQPASVSIGCHQLPDVIDLKMCKDLGWDVVFRSTGGRALLHKHDLSYSVIIPADGNSYRLFRRFYNNIGQAIAKALKSFGIDSDHSEPMVEKGRPDKPLRAGLCLDSRVRGEVSISGKKVAAAAQHVYRSSLLQHGSIMLRGDPAEIAMVSNLEQSKKQIMAERLRAKACSIEEYDMNININALVDMISNNFGIILGLELIEENWNSQEKEIISEMEDNFRILHCTEDLKLEAVR